MLREVAPDTLLLIEDSSQRGRPTLHSDMVCEEEETESAMASAHDQREEELQVKCHNQPIAYLERLGGCSLREKSVNLGFSIGKVTIAYSPHFFFQKRTDTRRIVRII